MSSELMEKNKEEQAFSNAYRKVSNKWNKELREELHNFFRVLEGNTKYPLRLEVDDALLPKGAAGIFHDEKGVPYLGIKLRNSKSLSAEESGDLVIITEEIIHLAHFSINEKQIQLILDGLLLVDKISQLTLDGYREEFDFVGEHSSESGVVKPSILTVSYENQISEFARVTGLEIDTNFSDLDFLKELLSPPPEQYPTPQILLDIYLTIDLVPKLSHLLSAELRDEIKGLASPNLFTSDNKATKSISEGWYQHLQNTQPTSIESGTFQELKRMYLPIVISKRADKLIQEVTRERIIPILKKLLGDSPSLRTVKVIEQFLIRIGVYSPNIGTGTELSKDELARATASMISSVESIDISTLTPNHIRKFRETLSEMHQHYSRRALALGHLIEPEYIEGAVTGSAIFLPMKKKLKTANRVLDTIENFGLKNYETTSDLYTQPEGPYANSPRLQESEQSRLEISLVRRRKVRSILLSQISTSELLLDYSRKLAKEYINSKPETTIEETSIKVKNKSHSLREMSTREEMLRHRGDTLMEPVAKVLAYMLNNIPVSEIRIGRGAMGGYSEFIDQQGDPDSSLRKFMGKIELAILSGGYKIVEGLLKAESVSEQLAIIENELRDPKKRPFSN